MNAQLARFDALFQAGAGDELPGLFGALAMGNHPADDIAAEDVEDDIQIEVSPLGGTQELRDIPAPEWIRGGGQQFRLLIGRMDELIAALTGLAGLGQQARHRSRRAIVLAFIEQCGGDLHGGMVLESFTMEMLKDGTAFVRIESADGFWPGKLGALERGALAIERNARHAQGGAGGGRSDLSGQFHRGCH